MSRGGEVPQERLEILWLSIAAAGLVLGLRLAQMQLVRAGEWRLAAERNRSQMIHQNAPRGRIYDRNGVPVATNAPAFSLIFLPGKDRRRQDLKPLEGEGKPPAYTPPPAPAAAPVATSTSAAIVPAATVPRPRRRAAIPVAAPPAAAAERPEQAFEMNNPEEPR